MINVRSINHLSEVMLEQAEEELFILTTSRSAKKYIGQIAVTQSGQLIGMVEVMGMWPNEQSSKKINILLQKLHRIEADEAPF